MYVHSYVLYCTYNLFTPPTSNKCFYVLYIYEAHFPEQMHKCNCMIHTYI